MTHPQTLTGARIQRMYFECIDKHIDFLTKNYELDKK